MKPKNKKAIGFSTILISLFTLFNAVFSPKIHAYSNPALTQDLKVGLVSMADSSLTVTLNGNYTLNGSTLPAGSKISVHFTNGSININGINYSQVQLTPLSQNVTLTLSNGTSTYKYKGSFLLKIEADKILPINSIDMDTYLKGVVGYEMSDYFPIEALKAQAVAARNFALSKIGYESARGFDFDDTTKYQVYRGYDERLKNSIRAVDETSGMLLISNGQLIEALYSASHGGYTEDSINVWGNPASYLISKKDTFDYEPWPTGNISFTNSQIESILKSKGYIQLTDTFINLDLASVTKYISGRVANINITYRDIIGIIKIKSITKDRTRTFLNLPSSMYNVSYDSATGIYTFTGKGNGHGLGMSQIGAKNRATSGQSFDQILKFYYNDSYIEKASYSTTPDYPDIPSLFDNSKINIILKSAQEVMSDRLSDQQ